MDSPQMRKNNTLSRRARILLAEDDRAMAVLIEIALQQSGFSYRLEIATDGNEAIAALEKASPEDRPDLFLLDLYMPGKDGFEVLEHIKWRENLRRIPVIMFSSSQCPTHVKRAYDLHANAYVLKEGDLPELAAKLESILSFWLITATAA